MSGKSDGKRLFEQAVGAQIPADEPASAEEQEEMAKMLTHVRMRLRAMGLKSLAIHLTVCYVKEGLPTPVYLSGTATNPNIRDVVPLRTGLLATMMRAEEKEIDEAYWSQKDLEEGKEEGE